MIIKVDGINSDVVVITAEELEIFDRVGHILLEKLRETHGEDAQLVISDSIGVYPEARYTFLWNQKQSRPDFGAFNVATDTTALINYLNNHNPY